MMKKLLFFLCLALICLNFVIGFAQSRRSLPTNEDKVKKKNQREPSPVETPTPYKDTPVVNNPEQENGEVDDSEIITVATNLVTIPVKVLDKNGRFVGGLTKENFKVFEDNAEKPIEYFSNEQEPFTVALVLDMSYSAKFKTEEIQFAALEFVNQLRPKDKVMVVSFDEEIYFHCEPTNDRKTLQTAIRQTKISYGTSIYDAMDLTMEKLKKIEGRKAIVLFSDGVDTTSEKTFDSQNLIDALELDALIYPIQYDTFNEVQAMKNQTVVVPPTQPTQIPSKNKNPLPFPLPTGGTGQINDKGTTREEYDKADQYLKELAYRTGGRLYPASTTTNLSKAFSKIASELREYYSIGIYPREDAEKGKKYRIKVRVDREGLAVKSRDSYSIKKEKNETGKR
jgi:VWFA-related protein